jgi:hypothetical protein
MEPPAMTFPITITIASAGDDRLRAETPAGPIEAATMGELGDLLKEVLVRLEAERGETDDLAEPAALSKTATHQATLRRLAGTSPPPPSWYDEDN